MCFEYTNWYNNPFNFQVKTLEEMEQYRKEQQEREKEEDANIRVWMS